MDEGLVEAVRLLTAAGFRIVTVNQADGTITVALPEVR